MLRRVVFGSLLSVVLLTITTQAVVVDVVDWTISSGDGPLTQQATNDPIVGNGATNSANSEAIHASISGAIPSLNSAGEQIILSGAVELVGSLSGNDQFRWGLFDMNGQLAIKGWLGYFAGNAISSSSSNLRERNNPNGADFFSGTSATLIASSNSPGTAFSEATYAFTLSLMRTGVNGLQIDWTLLKMSGSSAYSLAGSFIDPTPQTFSFNRVGLSLGGSLNAEQVLYHDITVQYVTVPEPSCALLAGAGLALGAARRARRNRR